MRHLPPHHDALTPFKGARVPASTWVIRFGGHWGRHLLATLSDRSDSCLVMLWDAPHHRPPSRAGAARLPFLMLFVAAVLLISSSASPGRHDGRGGPALATSATIPAPGALCQSTPACGFSCAHPGTSALLQAVPGLAARLPLPGTHPGGWLCRSCPAFDLQFCSPCSLLPQPAPMDAENAPVDVATAPLLGTSLQRIPLGFGMPEQPFSDNSPVPADVLATARKHAASLEPLPVDGYPQCRGGALSTWRHCLEAGSFLIDDTLVGCGSQYTGLPIEDAQASMRADLAAACITATPGGGWHLPGVRLCPAPWGGVGDRAQEEVGAHARGPRAPRQAGLPLGQSSAAARAPAEAERRGRGGPAQAPLLLGLPGLHAFAFQP